MHAHTLQGAQGWACAHMYTLTRGRMHTHARGARAWCSLERHRLYSPLCSNPFPFPAAPSPTTPRKPACALGAACTPYPTDYPCSGWRHDVRVPSGPTAGQNAGGLSRVQVLSRARTQLGGGGAAEPRAVQMCSGRGSSCNSSRAWLRSGSRVHGLWAVGLLAGCVRRPQVASMRGLHALGGRRALLCCLHAACKPTAHMLCCVTHRVPCKQQIWVQDLAVL